MLGFKRTTAPQSPTLITWGGGETRSDSCNSIARKLWELAKQCNMWLTAVHIPGRDNVIADRERHIFHDNTEWMLRDDIFQKCIKHFSLLVEVDFASRLNKK